MINKKKLISNRCFKHVVSCLTHKKKYWTVSKPAVPISCRREICPSARPKKLCNILSCSWLLLNDSSIKDFCQVTTHYLLGKTFNLSKGVLIPERFFILNQKTLSSTFQPNVEKLRTVICHVLFRAKVKYTFLD